MTEFLIPGDQLAKAKKILFITHLAIGDFTYLQNFFAAFAKQNPHLAVDIWIDELRRSHDPAKWPFLKKYALYDWAENCACFHKVYRDTYSPGLLDQSMRQAQQEQYPIVVSLATLRPHNYARLARTLAPDAFIVGIKGKNRWYAPWDNTAYANLNRTFTAFQAPASGYHITDVYADWFQQLSGLTLTQTERFPYVDIPTQWNDYAGKQLQQWGVTEEAILQGKKVVFINAFAKTKKRCWPLSHVAELIIDLSLLPLWRDTCFIVNAVPQEIEQVKQILASYNLRNTYIFSADENFFQLPAILRRCNLIISVETAVMHLANAVHIPVIALMRQKNPEWVPIDAAHSTVITTQKRREWVNSIRTEQVIKVI